jgi:nucleoside-diphosphate-sugar epimerase
MPISLSISLSECTSRIAHSRVLVTGGAGFIGSHLVDYLLNHGAREVVIVDDLSRSREHWLKVREENSRVRCIRSSILADMDAVLSGIDVVFHLAAIATVMHAVRNPILTFDVNTMATARLAAAAQRAGVRRFVFSSSREVYGDPAVLPVTEDAPLKPKNVYGASKAAAEMYLSTVSPEALEVVILRLSNVFGPGDTGRVIPLFFNNALSGKPLVLYGGEQVLDLIWIKDVIESLIKAGFSARPVPEAVNIGSGKATALHTVAQRISQLVGTTMPIEIAPPRGPEVERFQADLTRAKHYYDVCAKEDPLEHLADMLAALRAEAYTL